MKILTWNINGIRSVKKDQSLKKLFESLDCDIICLQETKVTRDMLEEQTAIVEGYNAYFSFSKVRSGYSGVATFCRNHVTPVKAEDRIDLPVSDSDDNKEENVFSAEELELLNAEGRTILTEHLDAEGNHVVIINLYCPRADLDNKERTEFKLKFYSLVEMKCKGLIQENKHVVVLGDFNVSHKLIDHCDPNDPQIFDSNPSRQWANSFIWDPSDNKPTSKSLNPEPQTTKFIDSFRFFHPNQKDAFTCWSTLTGARQTNYGTRIDYIFSNEEFFKKEFTDCIIRPDIEGSDHCPVVATLKNSFQNSAKPPSLCTKYLPEFSGKQQKLKDFFKKSDGNTSVCNSKDESGSRMEENMELDKVDSRKKKMSGDNSQPKVFEKRSADSTLKSQAKRMKTNSSVSRNQGKIFSFFEKKSSECVRGNNADSGKTAELVNKNESDSDVFEQVSNILPQNVGLGNSPESINASSQISTSSPCPSSGYSSQNYTESIAVAETLPAVGQDCAEEQPNSDEKSAAVISSWKNLLKGLPPPPPCSGHKEPCVLRTVKNKGPNHGKQFYCCARPQGHSTNKEARCNYFKWVKK